MNSKRGGGKVSLAAAASSSPRGRGIGSQYGHASVGSGFSKNSTKTDQPSQDIADPSLDNAQDGDWEVYGKKSRNRTGNSAVKPWGSSNAPPKGWGHQEMSQKKSMPGNGGQGKPGGNSLQTEAVDSRRPPGRGNSKSQSSNSWESSYTVPACTIPPPLQNGWQWAARAGSSNPIQTKNSEDMNAKNGAISKSLSPRAEDSAYDVNHDHPDDASDDAELVDSDNDFLSDDSDSDVSQKSFETRKKNRWFKAFFEALDSLTIEQINEPSRQWHCPACQDGPGAIDWYSGLQPLMTHAKTKGSKRVRLHRELGELLDEELQRRGTSVVLASEAFGKWKGLRETTTDHEIVWPPMVVIRNTLHEKDDNDKWIGMGNQELLDYFNTYDAVRARHSYGPQGHRGMSVLIFEGTAIGYLEAERLHNHFKEQNTGREAWDHSPVHFYPGGRRQLYGYLATKEDLAIFNQHSQGKSKLKYEVRSYQEMVVGPMKQMSEDNQQLIWYKNEVARQQQHKKALKDSMGVVQAQLRIANEDSRIVKERSKAQHQENKEEMDQMERFYKEQVVVFHETPERKEIESKEFLQKEPGKAKLSNHDSGNDEQKKLRREGIARSIGNQTKAIEFEAEWEDLMKLHESKTTEMKRRHHEEEVRLEKEFDAALTQLEEKYISLRP